MKNVCQWCGEAATYMVCLTVYAGDSEDWQRSTELDEQRLFCRACVGRLIYAVWRRPAGDGARKTKARKR